MHADIQGAVRLVRHAAEFEWTWRESDLREFCAGVNWQLEYTRDRVAKLVTDLAVNQREARVFLFHSRIEYISAPVSDVVLSGGRDATDQALRCFRDLGSALSEDLGTSSQVREFSSGDEMFWRLSKVVVSLMRSSRAVHLFIYSPERWELDEEMRRLDAETQELYEEE
ncbi:hypothetical protein IU429_29295 [Nocardia elegans]|uniref:DUF6301 family protein n=1 Tax=Nocardia elegans TaxID=300029 RepID=A0ABW6TL18_9NOCA|nr:DUF6301 family protein [Nocardia elegans]MBF6451765.1 hypothetical protein [Nocardia elegans]